MRLAAVDGFLLDVPDNEANRRAFGGPKDSSGKPGGFPQVRVVTLTETGTHSSIDARVGGYNSGERDPAVAMAASASGMLVIMDRGSPGWSYGRRISAPVPTSCCGPARVWHAAQYDTCPTAPTWRA